MTNWAAIIERQETNAFCSRLVTHTHTLDSCEYVCVVAFVSPYLIYRRFSRISPWPFDSKIPRMYSSIYTFCTTGQLYRKKHIFTLHDFAVSQNGGVKKNPHILGCHAIQRAFRLRRWPVQNYTRFWLEFNWFRVCVCVCLRMWAQRNMQKKRQYNWFVIW